MLYLISFRNSNFIHLYGSKSDYILEEKACFKIGQIFRRDLRFPFHYFIFIYFRCLISNIYLLSVYNESSQGSLVSISCYFLYLLQNNIASQITLPQKHICVGSCRWVSSHHIKTFSHYSLNTNHYFVGKVWN